MLQRPHPLSHTTTPPSRTMHRWHACELQDGVTAHAHDKPGSLNARNMCLKGCGKVAGGDSGDIHELPIRPLGEGLCRVHSSNAPHVECIPHLLERSVWPYLHTMGILLVFDKKKTLMFVGYNFWG